MATFVSAKEFLTRQVEQLEARKASLESGVKALDAHMLDLRSQVDLAEIDATQRIAAIRDQTEAERIKIVAVLDPLKAEYSALKSQIAVAQREYQRTQDSTRQHAADAYQALQQMKAQTQDQARVLAQITQEIATFKRRIGEL